MKGIEIGRITEHEQVAADMYRLVAELPRTAAAIRPGQFLHVRVGRGYDPFLRRPFSPSRVDAEKGLVEMMYRVVGRGTDLLRYRPVGSELDSLGPLGSTFTLDGKLLVVGGGVGIAPIMYATQVAAPGAVTAIIGGRNADELFWRHYFPAHTGQLLLTSDDGSLGHHGFTTDLVPDLLATGEFTRVLTCGPAIMMKKVAALAEAAGVPCEVSLERRMGCGTGGCLACVVDTPDGMHRKVCDDGPVFDSREVVL